MKNYHVTKIDLMFSDPGHGKPTNRFNWQLFDVNCYLFGAEWTHSPYFPSVAIFETLQNHRHHHHAYDDYLPHSPRGCRCCCCSHSFQALSLSWQRSYWYCCWWWWCWSMSISILSIEYCKYSMLTHARILDHTMDYIEKGDTMLSTCLSLPLWPSSCPSCSPCPPPCCSLSGPMPPRPTWPSDPTWGPTFNFDKYLLLRWQMHVNTFTKYM